MLMVMLVLKSCVLALAATFYRSMSLSSAVPCRTLPDQDYFALSSSCRCKCGRLPTIDSFYPSIQATITLSFIDVALLVIAVEAHTAPLADVHVVKHRLGILHEDFPVVLNQQGQAVQSTQIAVSIDPLKQEYQRNEDMNNWNSHLMDTASAQKLCRMKEP